MNTLNRKIWISLYRKKWLMGIIVLLATGFSLFWNSLPEELFPDPLSPVLFSREGHLMGASIAADHQWRFPSNGNVPEKYRISLIQFEDKRFFHHPGVDFAAMSRALFTTVIAGKRTSGGSTLTMQVMRLAGKKIDRNIFDKFKEIIQALRLELKYSKEEILSFYAAHAPFGGNIVGLDAASWFYFGRSPLELSWAESALLAVLPNSPALIHPGKNQNILLKKRNRLLLKLNKKGIITDLELALAIKESLPKGKKALPRLAPHVLDTLTGLFKNRSQRLFYSTLQKDLQQHVSALCEENWEKLKLKDIKNVAAIVIDNRSAEVIAYVGNTGLGGQKDNGQHVDIVRAARSTGSILKPFLYAAMLTSGEIAPTTLVPDIPTQYDGFMPENFDREYSGVVAARDALAQSLNIPAVRMLRQFGVHRFYGLLKRSGITTLNRVADDYGLTLILGGAEASLYEVTSLYSRLAQLADVRNRLVSPIRLIKDNNRQLASMKRFSGGPGGGFLEKSPLAAGGIEPISEPFGRGAAYLTLEALIEVVRPGVDGFWKTFSSSRKIAWKTGTSYGFRDAWAVGVTPHYTVGVWVGNADGEGKPGLTGVSAAAPVLFDIFNFLDLKDDEWFEKPYTLLKSMKLCKKSGCLATDLCETEIVWIPVESHFSKVCPYHHRIHLDSQGVFRVDSRCESLQNMQHIIWFTLPPLQEFFYQKRHPEYKKLPPYRWDCMKTRNQNEKGVIDLIYPSYSTCLYIPVDLDGNRGETIFQAVHREPNTVVYWHIDDHYIGKTVTFHQMALSPEAGDHRLILVDGHGNRLERKFRVLDKGD